MQEDPFKPHRKSMAESIFTIIFKIIGFCILALFVLAVLAFITLWIMCGGGGRQSGW